MIFYLEGPDGAGKTTLGDQIARSLEAQGEKVLRTHHGPPGDLPAWDLYGRSLYQFQFLSEHHGYSHMVMDRAWLSHHVYEPLLGRPDQLEWTYRNLERWAMRFGITMILCRPNLATCMKNWEDRASRKEELIPEGQSELVRRVIFEFWKSPIRTHLPVVNWDYTTMDFHIQTVRDNLIGIPIPQTPFHFPGVGAWRPGKSVLMVAEKANNLDVPLVNNKGSGAWLARKLEEAQISEQDLFWINALDLKGEWTSPKFLEELRPESIVCLGKKAEQWASEFAPKGVTVVGAPHPSNWMRFHHHAPYPLIPILHEVLK